MKDDEPSPGSAGDYLWDRSGASDPQLVRLERLLGTYGHAAAPWSRNSGVRVRRRTQPHRRFGRWRMTLAVAAVLALCALGLRGWYHQRLQWGVGRPWQVQAQGDGLRVNGRPAGAHATLAPRELLETGPTTTARLRIADIGQLALGPDSRLRLLQTRSGHHRVALEHGTLWARVWAPPGQFGVDVAGADLVDLGCEFVLRIDAAGNGTLEVRSGWVQVNDPHREVLVPEGMRVRLNGSGAAGIPFATDADPRFIAALDEINARNGAVSADGEVVSLLLAHTRARDAFSLLALLQAYPRLGDGPILKRLAQLLPTSPVATRAAWRADRDAVIEAWWRALPYPRVKRWWLQWPDALPVATPDRGELEAMLKAPSSRG